MLYCYLRRSLCLCVITRTYENKANKVDQFHAHKADNVEWKITLGKQ